MAFGCAYLLYPAFHGAPRRMGVLALAFMGMSSSVCHGGLV